MSKRKKGRSRPSDYERFEAPGVTLERLGRFMTLKTHRTPEEQRALNEAWQQAFRALPDKIKTQAQRVAQIFRAFNTFDLLALISLTNLLMDPNTYVESEQKGSSFVVEYATLILLKDEYHDGAVISPEAFSEAKVLLRSIQDDLGFLVASRSADPDDVGPPSDLEELQVSTELWELSVRSLAYEHHLRAVLEKLFSPFDDSLVSVIGFGYGDALRIISAIDKMTSRKIIERAAEGRRCRDELVRAVERSRRGLAPPPHLSELVATFKHLSKKELADQLTITTSAFIFTLAGKTISFSAADIVAETSLDELRVRAFLSAFSLTFGDIPPDFYVPMVFHPLKEKPIVRHDERYLCPVPGLLDWAVKPMLESALRGTQQLWHRYESHRHDYTVREAIRLLGMALPSSEAHTELHYSVGGESLDGELDALLSVDSALVLLEAKAGAFTTPAKEGKPQRLQRDLGTLVAKAHAQANRSYQYLKSGDEVRFQVRGGGKLRLRHQNFPHIFLISVLLEPLGHITTRLAATSLVTTQGHEHVWTVSLYDLMVIAELAEPFPLILHYILRRVQALKQGLIEAHDELDLFGAYLDSGLFFRGGDFERLDSLEVGTFTDMFDAYFMHQAGRRTKYVTKPAVRMSGEFRNFILALGISGLPRRLDVLLHLLDMDGESRQYWIRAVVATKRRFRRDGRLHTFTQMEDNGGFGLVYYCGPEEEDRLEHMEQYSRHKMRQIGATGFIAIEDTQRTPGYAFRRTAGGVEGSGFSR